MRNYILSLLAFFGWEQVTPAKYRRVTGRARRKLLRKLHQHR